MFFFFFNSQTKYFERAIASINFHPVISLRKVLSNLVGVKTCLAIKWMDVG